MPLYEVTEEGLERRPPAAFAGEPTGEGKLSDRASADLHSFTIDGRPYVEAC